MKQIGVLVMTTFAGALTLFFSSWFIWGYIIQPIKMDTLFNCDGLYPAEPNMGFISLSYICTSLLISIVLYNSVSKPSFKVGGIYGLIISTLSWLACGLMTLGTTSLFTSTTVFYDSCGYMFTGFLTGGIIGLILSKIKAS